MERQKIGWMPIVMYVFAIIFGLYTIYALVSTGQYIGQMVAAQYIVVSESMADIIAYFVTNVGAYLFYALMLGAGGYIIDALQRGVAPKKVKAPKEKAHVPETAPAVETEEDATVSDAVTEEAEEKEEVVVEEAEEVAVEATEDAEA